MIHYRIGSSHPAAHYFDLVLEIAHPDPSGQVLRLPAWIPGSYMIRDFARNIVEIAAYQDETPVAMTQLDKSSWRLAPVQGAVSVHYRVYAWDLSVRGAHLDNTHGFFNGTSVFLEVVGQSDQPCEVMIDCPTPGYCADWQLATTLRRRQGGFDDFGFGLFEADDYQDLIDHPVEMGRFERFDFEAGGIRHDMVLTGKFECDVERMKVDLAKICQQQIDLFGAPPPMPRYLFLVMVVGEGYGGLEHRSSTALVCSRKDLPKPGQSRMTEEYLNFLGLCSHEYFHSWNVKRIRPAVFVEPDLSTEVYTPLLWAFEGITSYYDDLALVRSGCIDASRYLELLAQMITRVQRNPGRLRQSVAESSFNAWNKFYKQDENALNAIVSYYSKGSLVALCIDLKLRQLSNGEKSLDDVMRLLWADFVAGREGIADDDIQRYISQLAGEDLSEFLHQLINTTEELPLAQLLEQVSVRLDFRASAGAQDKGGKEQTNLPAGYTGMAVQADSGGLKIQSLVEQGPAQQAGLSAGDVIVAIDGLRADMEMYQAWLQHSAAGASTVIFAFRRDELMQFELTLAAPPANTAMLTIVDESDPALRQWLAMD